MVRHRSPTTRGRLGRASIIAVGALVLTTLSVFTPAQAVPPANDTWQTATPVTALSFTDTLDTTEATTDAGMGKYRFHAIWYHLQLPNDGMIYLYLDGSEFEPQGLRLFHAKEPADPPDQWAALRFDDGDLDYPAATTVEVVAGKNYYVMVGTTEDAPGGQVRLTVRRPARVTYSLAATGKLDRVDGSAVLHGTVRATRKATVLLQVGLRQLVRDRLVTAYAHKRIEATRETAPWSLRLSPRRIFKLGPARIIDDRLTVYDGPLFVGRYHFVRRVVELR